MSLLEQYRVLYEYEIDCNQKMLAMLESVPEASRSDARFQRGPRAAAPARSAQEHGECGRRQHRRCNGEGW